MSWRHTFFGKFHLLLTMKSIAALALLVAAGCASAHTIFQEICKFSVFLIEWPEGSLAIARTSCQRRLPGKPQLHAPALV